LHKDYELRLISMAESEFIKSGVVNERKSEEVKSKAAAI
jgi:hypothetical protein